MLSVYGYINIILYFNLLAVFIKSIIFFILEPAISKNTLRFIYVANAPNTCDNSLTYFLY